MTRQRRRPNPPPGRWIFDGVDDKISAGDFLSKERTDWLTLSAWVDPQVGSNSYIIAKNAADSTARGYVLYFRSSAPAGVMLEFNNNSASAANTLKVYAANTLAAPGHVVATYDGSSTAAGCKIYFNGVSQALTTLYATLSATTISNADLRVSHFLTGRVRHASMWNATLSAAEVTELYNGGAPGNLLAHSRAANVILWWKFDERDSAAQVIDYAATPHHGTPQGGIVPQF